MVPTGDRAHRALQPNTREVVLAGLIILLICLRAWSADGECTAAALAAYNGYTVAEVQLRDPIGFIIPFNPLDKTLREGLKLKKGGTFSNQIFEEDSQKLNDTLTARFAASAMKVKFSYAGGKIVDCMPADPSGNAHGTLRVIYPIFTSVLPLPQPTYEEQSNEARRPGTTGALRAEETKPVVIPLIGNDSARGTFGGIRFSNHTRWVGVAGQTEVSGNSRSGYLTLGSPSAAKASADHPTVLAGSFVYEDTPVGFARFRESKFNLRASSSIKLFGSDHSVFRYGSAIEGGRQDSTAVPSANIPPDSNLGSLKFYAGLTGLSGTSGFTASTGFQLGSTLRAGSSAFGKYLVDLGYSHAFPVNRPKPLGDQDLFTHIGLTGDVHRSFFLDTHFTAGLIQNAADAPLAERFFGGNVVQPFIPDDSWSIPTGAFIRSIPENRLGALSNSALGGSRFFSANVTVTFTVWGKPMLPKELVISENPAKPGAAGQPNTTEQPTGFPEVLNFPFKTAALAIANTKELADPTFVAELKKAVSATAKQLSQKCTDLLNAMKQIPSDLAGQKILKKQISDVRGNLFSVREGANEVAANPDPQVLAAVTGSVPGLLTMIDQLTKGLAGTSANGLIPQLKRLTGEIDFLSHQIGGEDNVPTTKYVDAAYNELAPAHRALDVFIHDLNIYAISPVAMLDAARVWPTGGGVRYGVGPGLRLSIINVNVTFGYSFDVDRRPGEESGAIYLKLDVTSLF
jgi:hypothetical protein